MTKLIRDEVLELLQSYRKAVAEHAKEDEVAKGQLDILLQLECDIRNLEATK